MMDKKKTIDYKYIDGAHFFTSEDVEGFCVASVDLFKALEEVPLQLIALHKWSRND